MKKYIPSRFFIPLLTLLLSTHLQAQLKKIVPQECSTKTPAILKQYSPEQISTAEKTINYLYVLKIYVHILRNNDGTNAATTETQMYADLQNMANFFKPHNICFMFVGFDYVNNTFLNNSMNPKVAADEAALIANNKHNDAIDIYVQTSFGIASGGNSYNIPSDHYSVIQSANFNFYHEMGHCLGLFHTFETGSGVECPDGSNCGAAGDLICDTRADFSGSENAITPPNACTYNGTQMINCNGLNRSYNPPTDNIMSYWAACYARFSPQQAIRMRTTIATEAVVNKCLVRLNENYYTSFGNAIISNEWHLAATNEIHFGTTDPAYTLRIGGGNQMKVVNAGTRITLHPGTIISPTVGLTKLLINPLCE